MKTQRIVASGLATVLCIGLLGFGCSTPSSGIPGQLGDLHLQEWIEGKEARELINQLHHRSVAPGEDFVGEYIGKDGSATLYLSVYDEPSMAVEAMERMTKGIAAGGTPFSHPKDYPASPARRIKTCFGMDQTHFFFADDRKVIWLSVDEPIAEATLNHLLAALTQ